VTLAIGAFKVGAKSWIRKFSATAPAFSLLLVNNEDIVVFRIYSETRREGEFTCAFPELPHFGQFTELGGLCDGYISRHAEQRQQRERSRHRERTPRPTCGG